MPGSPEERYTVSYKINGVLYDHNIAERVDGLWDNPIKMPETRDESDLDKGILKAVVSGITKENIKVDITYSFEVDDKYYLTEVKITNLSDKEINNIRFLRSFDPDQDVAIYNTYETYNKVICNPNSENEGSDSNYAMVVAHGEQLLDGFFFVSFDNRARVSRGVSFSPDSAYLDGLWVSDSSIPTYSTEEMIELSKSNSNWYIKEDNAVAITFDLDKLNAGKSVEFNYYSSLDPNVLSSIAKILKAVSASVKKYTDNSIEIDVQEGYEYSIDNGITWQETGIFDNLEPNQEYIILSRINETDTTPASEPESITITTK